MSTLHAAAIGQDHANGQGSVTPAEIKAFSNQDGIDVLNPADNPGFTTGDSKSLKGDARVAFKRLEETWASDYQPEVYHGPVNGKATTWIAQDTGGSREIYVFDSKGALKASGDCSESGTFGWGGRASLPDPPSKD